MKGILSILWLLICFTVSGQKTEIGFVFGDELHLLPCKVGGKVFFRDLNYNVWESDGTKAGTAQNDKFGSFCQQLSADSLLFIKESQAVLFTESGGFQEFEGDKIIFDGNVRWEIKEEDYSVLSISGYDFIKYAFIDLVKQKTTVKTFPEGTRLALFNGHLLLHYNGEPALYLINMDDYSTELIADVGSPIFHVKELPWSKELLIITKDKLFKIEEGLGNPIFISNIEAFNNSDSERFDSYMVNNHLVFFYSVGLKSYFYSTDGAKAGTFLLREIDKFGAAFHSKKYAFVSNGLLFLYTGEEKSIKQINDNFKKIWTTDGTIQGSKDYENYIDFNGQKGPTFVGLELDSNLVHRMVYFDGKEFKDIVPEDEQLFLYFFSIENTFYFDNYCHIQLLDLEKGFGIYRFDFISKELKRIYDIKEYTRPFAFVNNKLLFYNRDDRNSHIFALEGATTLQNGTNTVDWIETIVGYPSSGNRPYSQLTLQGISVDEKGNSLVVVHNDGPNDRLIAIQNKFKISKASVNDYLYKFDEDGHLEWIKTFPFFGSELIAKFNNSDQVIVSFVLPYSVTIENIYLNVSDGNLVVLKFNSDGELIWHRQGKIGEGRVQSVEINKENDIHIFGKFAGAIASFDGHDIFSDRNPTTFVASYDKKGSVEWATSFPLPAVWPVDVGRLGSCASSDDTLFFYQRIGNDFYSDCQESSFRILVNAVSGSTGKKLWSKEFIGDDFCYVSGIDASPKGFIYLTGGYKVRIKFDDFELINQACEETKLFVLKMDFKGVVVSVNELDIFEGAVNDLKCDSKGNYFICGSQEFNFYNNIFLPANMISDSEHFHSGIFIKKYNSFGQETAQHTYHQASKATKRINFNPMLETLPNDKLLLGLEYSRFLNQTNMADLYHGTKVFLQKLALEPNFPIDDELQKEAFTILPNPTVDRLYINSIDLDFSNAEIKIYGIDGRLWNLPITYEEGLGIVDVSHLPKGVYLAAIYLMNKVLAEKFVKL